MHIPDGMLDTKTWLTCWLGTGGVLWYASRWIQRYFDQSKIVVMAVLASLIFALQMLNFPIAGGTSGHFGGGVLAGIVLGPVPATFVMSAVLTIQALVFQDGGITTLGANILNMGIIAPFVGWAIYAGASRLLKRPAAKAAAAGIAAWAGVFISACAVAIELWASNAANFFAVLAPMVFWHALIGIGEGIITAGVVAYLQVRDPSILFENATASNLITDSTSKLAKQLSPRGANKAVLVVLFVLALLAACCSFLASSYPDGLEYVFYTTLGNTSTEATLIASPMPDYSVLGVQNEAFSTVLAGIFGVLIVAVLILAFMNIRAMSKGAVKKDTVVSDALPLYVRVDTRAPFLGTIALIVGIVCTSPVLWSKALLLALVVIFLALLNRLSLLQLLKRSLVILPFAGLIALFTPTRLIESWTWSGIAQAYAQGWPLIVNVVLIAWFSALFLIILVQTCGTERILIALERMHAPSIFITLLMFITRYLNMFRAQIRAMQHSIDARAPFLHGYKRLKVYGSLAGALIVRSAERGERVYQAMLARGYNGTIPVLEPTRFGWKSWAVLIAFILLIVLLVFM